MRGHDTVGPSGIARCGGAGDKRSAHQEALLHLTGALTLLHGLPETPERVRQELELQLALGPALIAPRRAEYLPRWSRLMWAQALCHWLGETPQIFPTLRGLWRRSLESWRVADGVNWDVPRDPVLLPCARTPSGRSLWLSTAARTGARRRSRADQGEVPSLLAAAREKIRRFRRAGTARRRSES